MTLDASNNTTVEDWQSSWQRRISKDWDAALILPPQPACAETAWGLFHRSTVLLLGTVPTAVGPVNEWARVVGRSVGTGVWISPAAFSTLQLPTYCLRAALVRHTSLMFSTCHVPGLLQIDPAILPSIQPCTFFFLASLFNATCFYASVYSQYHHP